ncbi:hypothetical protein ACTQ5K_02770 [Niallia sp. Sow4_A1]|uniref:hypothetical protein n=1 Tax=Niallia sp. Sow4_A1 TaxID=3438793 RepID=UPI003F96F6E9
MYKVISIFSDLEDNKRVYEAGDTFPREGVEVSESRLNALSTNQNAAKKILIKKVEVEYPQHSGGAYYQLSNGEKVKGKEAAIEAEKALNGE